MAIHLIKLCVGCDTVEELLDWRRQNRRADQRWILRTRNTPRRALELVEAGSLYRVYRGFILSRQRILAVRSVEEGSEEKGAARRCEIELDETVVLTVPTPRRPFQGWRYLGPADAPADLAQAGPDAALSPDLAQRLRQIGAW